MPAPDDFTMALLRGIQLERTTPEGGWMDARQLSLNMSLSAHEEHHLKAPLQELFEAGMVEKRFNARLGRDEWRSVGTLPSLSRDALAPSLREQAAPLREDDAVVEEHMARRLVNILMTTGREEWFADGDLMHALDTEDLGAVWSGLNLLEASGLIQRRTDGRAIRLHHDLRRWS